MKLKLPPISLPLITQWLKGYVTRSGRFMKKHQQELKNLSDELFYRSTMGMMNLATNERIDDSLKTYPLNLVYEQAFDVFQERIEQMNQADNFVLKPSECHKLAGDFSAAFIAMIEDNLPDGGYWKVAIK